MYRLFFIDGKKIICKNILCKSRAQIRNAFSCEVGICLLGGVDHEMNMRMMALIMKSGIPFQILHRDFKIICDCLRLCAKHIPPAFTGIEAESFRVLTAKRNNHRPHITFVLIQFLGHLFEFYTDAIVCKQTMRAKTLSSRTGCNIVRVCFYSNSFIGVIFQDADNKL